MVLDLVIIIIFSCRLNISNDGCDVSVAGKLFHTRAPATAKARSPRVRRRVKLVKQGNNTACITCVRYAVVTSSSAIAKTAHVALLTLVISIYRASAY